MHCIGSVLCYARGAFHANDAEYDRDPEPQLLAIRPRAADPHPAVAAKGRQPREGSQRLAEAAGDVILRTRVLWVGEYARARIPLDESTL